jgi:hypothetical protein
LINPGARPNALLSINNGIGQVTLIDYEPSTSFALADAAAGKPWTDPMPFPVQVVSAVTNLDSLGHQYATQFSYHNAIMTPSRSSSAVLPAPSRWMSGIPRRPPL